MRGRDRVINERNIYVFLGNGWRFCESLGATSFYFIWFFLVLTMTIISPMLLVVCQLEYGWDYNKVRVLQVGGSQKTLVEKILDLE
jgi:hypothetical protein